MNADVPSLSLSWLDELEKRLLSDLEMVRQMKVKLQQSATTSPPPPAIAASFAIPPTPPPPPPYPNRLISDVKVAVRAVLSSLISPFGISEVKQQLTAQHFRQFGDSTLRSTLHELKDAGEILLTERNLGRTGNRYSLPPSAS